MKQFKVPALWNAAAFTQGLFETYFLQFPRKIVSVLFQATVYIFSFSTRF